MEKQFIDISKWNKVTDWTRVAARVGAVYIKATEGINYADPDFKTNAVNAEKQDIDKGFYHFATLNNSTNVQADARAEAEDFLKATAPFTARLPYVLDVETNKSALKPAQVVEWIEAFFGRLAESGITDVVLYSYTPFLDKNLPKGHPLGKYRLWLAAYVNLPKPKLPKGWTGYWLWQYSNKGSVDGIRGPVDLNKKP